ncbi:Hypothetical protein D9617_5g070350 [Elsinoe fawcettii]|nr:Hypothetical protein D9617_5g070350 [Elsinoe fawcettii]
MSITHTAPAPSVYPYLAFSRRPAQDEQHGAFKPINTLRPPLDRATPSTTWSSPSKMDMPSIPLVRRDLDTRKDSAITRVIEPAPLAVERPSGMLSRTGSDQGRPLGLTLPPLPGLEDKTQANPFSNAPCRTCKNFSVMVKDMSNLISELTTELAKDMGPAISQAVPAYGYMKNPQQPEESLVSLDESLRRIHTLKTDLIRFRTRSMPPNQPVDPRAPVSTPNYTWHDSPDHPRKRRRSLSPSQPQTMHRTPSTTHSAPSPPPIHPYQRLYESRTSTTHDPPPAKPFPSPPALPRPPLDDTDLARQLNQRTTALHALQSEHASLLQKFSRERARISAIEKKASVSEREVNSLTATNEDMMEQIRALETSVEEAERKVADMRGEMGREKGQWRGMLENQTRLMERYIGEKKEWRTEKRGLEMVVEGLRREVGALRLEEGVRGAVAAGAEGREREGQEGKGEGEGLGQSSEHADRFWDHGELSRLEGEVRVLKDQVDVLKSALASSREDHAAVKAQAQRIVDAITVGDEKLEQALGSTV